MDGPVSQDLSANLAASCLPRLIETRAICQNKCKGQCLDLWTDHTGSGWCGNDCAPSSEFFCEMVAKKGVRQDWVIMITVEHREWGRGSLLFDFALSLDNCGRPHYFNVGSEEWNCAVLVIGRSHPI